jgi:glycosyltransferase involved in cell wall biosynthesis
MRLLLITNRYPVDADDSASPFVPHFVEALLGEGVHVDVLTPDYQRPSRESISLSPKGGEGRGEGGTIHRFTTGSYTPIGSWNLASPLSWLRLMRFLRNGRQLGERLCAENPYDHILALWALPSGHFARSLGKRFGIPYSVWCLGSDIYVWPKRPFIRGQIASVLKHASAVYGDGHDLCQRVENWLGIKAEFMPSFRPLSGLSNCEPPRPTEAPCYLSLGRLHPSKGVFDLLNAFVEVQMILPYARLRFVGGGPAEAKLRSEIARLGLSSAAEVEGPVGEETIRKRLNECHCIVIPTRSDSIPLVFTEAVQAMRPVIGTDVGDLGAIIKRYRLGLVTPSTNRGDLALSMIQMAREPVFDLQGRAELLRLFDPRSAAKFFCQSTFGRAGELPGQPPRQTPADIRKREYIT